MEELKKTTQPDLPDSSPLEQQLLWECRYSQDEQPDKKGRWARKCFFKDRHIAWVDRFEINGIVRFNVITKFPVNGNDMPHFCSHFESFKEAKECVEFFWRQFIKVCQ